MFSVCERHFIFISSDWWKNKKKVIRFTGWSFSSQTHLNQESFGLSASVWPSRTVTMETLLDLHHSPLQATSSLLTPSFTLTSCCSMCGTQRTASRSTRTTRPPPAPERWRCPTMCATTTTGRCWTGLSLTPGWSCVTVAPLHENTPTHTNMWRLHSSFSL